MFIELIRGCALLLALCFLHGFNLLLARKRPRLAQMFAGIVFGGIGLIGMFEPVALIAGARLDDHPMLLALAGLFWGPLAGGLAAAMALGGLVWSSGAAGVPPSMAVGVILLSSAAGMAAHAARARGRWRVGPAGLAAGGLLLHLAVLLFSPLSLAPVGASLPLLVWLLVVHAGITVLMGLALNGVEERLAAEQASMGTAARLRALGQAFPDVLLVLDAEGRYLEVLSSDDSQLAARASDLIGKRMHDVFAPAQADAFLMLIRRTLASGKTQRIDYELQTLSGLLHFEGHAQPLEIPLHGRPAVVFAARDVTTRKQAESALRESEMRFRSLLRSIPSVAVHGYREDGTTTYWNLACEQLYGYTADEAIGSRLSELVVPAPLRDTVARQMQHAFATGEVVPAGEAQLQRKDGSRVDVFSSQARIHVAGHPPEIFCFDIDISGRKAAEDEARYLALYDALTQLPNRRLLVDRLQQVQASSARTGLVTAVLFVDLDNFKTLNDTRGHEVGDILLKEVAQRLSSSVREHDTVARLGGDEFVVVLQNLSADPPEAAAQARARADTLLARLRQPYVLAGQEHHGSASIGVTLLRNPTEAVDEVLKQADMAMYRAKEGGRNTLRFFDPEMQQAINRRALLESELRTGLGSSQFLLLYQPQVNCAGRVTGAEALVRWQHPVHGVVPPSEFIPFAEESGQILPLGHWVMQTAMRQQARWRRDAALGQLSLAINVSARQFLQDDFVAQVLRLLEETGADPARIKLELTESLLLDSVDSVIATMRALKAHGVGFSLDDFGTGYSSLSYLKRLPLDQIKIDQAFVRGVLQEPNDAAIARSIIALADSLGLDVIAEGVETAAHHDFLLSHGCRAFQGYLFGRPMALSEFEGAALRVLGPQVATAC